LRCWRRRLLARPLNALAPPAPNRPKPQNAHIHTQIFTKPLGDRPTVFVEIIQRIGCMRPVAASAAAAAAPAAGPAPAPAPAAPPAPPAMEQAFGCGGFGKGNFSELFKSIEDYERTLNV